MACNGNITKTHWIFLDSCLVWRGSLNRDFCFRQCLRTCLRCLTYGAGNRTQFTVYTHLTDSGLGGPILNVIEDEALILAEYVTIDLNGFSYLFHFLHTLEYVQLTHCINIVYVYTDLGARDSNTPTQNGSELRTEGTPRPSQEKCETCLLETRHFRPTMSSFDFRRWRRQHAL